MLDTRDVRAGNWVIKITGRDINTKSFFEYKPIALDEYYYTFAKVCFPIKLSTFILDKCGFKKKFDYWYINFGSETKDDGPPFLKYEHRNNCWLFRGVKIPAQPLYLHQLQNLFYSLTKQELNIQLGNFANLAMAGPIDFFIKPLKRTALISEVI
jgi:hypothetical protein